LVENSIRHGIARLSGPGVIRVSAAVCGDFLSLCVADTGPGLSDEQPEGNGHGIGLSNTRKRLKQLYPEHEMDIVAGATGGFEVRMCIPLTFSRVELRQELISQ
jgi:LytS/YehU family sensor histidine kinase